MKRDVSREEDKIERGMEVFLQFLNMYFLNHYYGSGLTCLTAGVDDSFNLKI
jgi:hypothetical protein